MEFGCRFWCWRRYAQFAVGIGGGVGLLERVAFIVLRMSLLLQLISGIGWVKFGGWISTLQRW